METLAGRVAAVTGAAGGIGSATCLQVARAGGCVVLSCKDREGEAHALAEQLPGDEHLGVRAVDDSSSLAELAERIAVHYSRPDLFVNNAGVTRFVSHDNL